MKYIPILILFWVILFGCGLGSAVAFAPQSTPVPPTPTPIPVPSGYSVLDLSRYVLIPVLVPDDTSDQEDATVMNETYEQLKSRGLQFLLLKCVERGDAYWCSGATGN